MLEAAYQYALELLHALEVCTSKDDLVAKIICDWNINSGCEYDDSCCEEVPCCEEVSLADQNVVCNISFQSTEKFIDSTIITQDGTDIELQIPIIDVPGQCNILIQEI